jgi:hypothetical protein
MLCGRYLMDVSNERQQTSTEVHDIVTQKTATFDTNKVN